MTKRLGKRDIILLTVILGILITLLILMKYVFVKSGDSVIIEQDGKVYGSYSLMKNQRIEILDKDGNVTNVLEIQDGKADMTEAKCPDRVCVHQAAIEKTKQNIVCLPNKIVVYILDSSDENDIDAIAE